MFDLFNPVVGISHKFVNKLQEKNAKILLNDNEKFVFHPQQVLLKIFMNNLYKM